MVVHFRLDLITRRSPPLEASTMTWRPGTDVAFAGGKAFVAVFQEDALRVFNLSDLTLPPQKLDLFGNNPRALAVSKDGSTVYAVVQNSGNQTTVINVNSIFGNGIALDAT